MKLQRYAQLLLCSLCRKTKNSLKGFVSRIFRMKSTGPKRKDETLGISRLLVVFW